MPVPGAPSYTLSNLEHSVIGALAPAWFSEVWDVFYYSGLTRGWFIIVATI